MKKYIRFTAMLLAHVGLLLSVVYLIFFLVCSAKANRTAEALADPALAETVSEQDMHLEKAMHGGDFSLLSVGKALSDKDDPGRDNLLLIVDLIIPVLCLASGILLQIASVRKKRKIAAQPQGPAQRSYSEQTTIHRRQS